MIAAPQLADPTHQVVIGSAASERASSTSVPGFAVLARERFRRFPDFGQTAEIATSDEEARASQWCAPLRRQQACEGGPGIRTGAAAASSGQHKASKQIPILTRTVT